ncbi:serine/threonine protein kinase [Nocardiopsis sp. Huas11]|uniref:serine/threonine-protein kinase n=1 Tax=Nocardiopsis sp. Huas11 TaxID=2183912 RepID=UPI000EB23C12|nr:serine/threonine-protein kinase [Nocardiopsis sp. Huas11]RKS10791.1 serine/threonine protein kinase [Nocardiopsis sp. Huas11]
MSSPGRSSVGRYELQERLGAGGMGTVWRAWDPALQRDVAVKEVLLPDGMDAQERAEAHARSMREAQATARIQSTAVVAVHDVLDDGESPWIVMELLSGRSLAQHLEQHGPMPVERVEEAARSLLGGLKAAHAAGVTHRDVKPANIMLTDDDRTVLTDFGIANVDGSTALTQTGVYIGSPEYMAPERFEGERALPASDLWSLGVTLFALLEGRSPFKRDSITGIITAVLTAPVPPPLTAVSGSENAAGAALRELIAALLDRDAAQRPDPDQALALLKRAKSAAGNGSGGGAATGPNTGAQGGPGGPSGGVAAFPAPGHGGSGAHTGMASAPGHQGHPGSPGGHPTARQGGTGGQSPAGSGPHTPQPYGAPGGPAQPAHQTRPQTPPTARVPQPQPQPQQAYHQGHAPGQQQRQQGPGPGRPTGPQQGTGPQPPDPAHGPTGRVGSTPSGGFAAGGTRTGYHPMTAQGAQGVPGTGPQPGATARFAPDQRYGAGGTGPLRTARGGDGAPKPVAVIAASAMLGVNALYLMVLTALYVAEVLDGSDDYGWGTVTMLGAWGLFAAFAAVGLMTRSRLLYGAVVIVQIVVAVLLVFTLFSVLVYSREQLWIYALALVFQLVIGGLLLVPPKSRAFFGFGEAFGQNHA